MASKQDLTINLKLEASFKLPPAALQNATSSISVFIDNTHIISI